MPVADWRDVIHEHELDVLRQLKKGATIIDVGANAGQYGEAVRDVLGAEAALWGFEPNRATRSALFAFPHDRLCLVALGAEDGEATLHTKQTGDVEGSLYKRADEHVLRDHWQRDDLEWGEQLVRVCRLDGFADELPAVIDLLKLDVEGHELAVLQGAAGVMDRVQRIQFEFSFTNKFNPDLWLRDLWALLVDQHGFRLRWPHPLGGWVDLQPPYRVDYELLHVGQTDFLAVR